MSANKPVRPAIGSVAEFALRLPTIPADTVVVLTKAADSLTRSVRGLTIIPPDTVAAFARAVGHWQRQGEQMREAIQRTVTARRLLCFHAAPSEPGCRRTHKTGLRLR